MVVAGLIALFIAVPLAELYVIIEVVGGAIGPVWTIALLALDSVLGSLLLRSQGRTVWRRFNEALAENRMPHREVQDGVLVIFGGAFLITPGFITDIVGLLLLIPFTRAPIRRFIMARLGKRFAVGVVSAAGRRARDPQRPYDVEGTAAEAETPAPRLER
ncbi:MAG: FxsA family protein [Thermoleophilaceae bacterium]|nr:FxsA family protein [Thermoleophilaceae bacterium]